MRHSILTLAATLTSSVGAATVVSPSNATATTTVVLPAGTVVGSVSGGVESFGGIPYAQPPTNSMRLKPPVRLESFGTVQATGVGPACPQMSGTDVTPLLLSVLNLPDVEETVLFGSSTGDETEDCLTVSVMRPQGTTAGAKLPVLFWIFGGGFETGSPQMYNGSVLIPQSVAQGKPLIFVSVNYRLAAFGFLGGSEVLADGAANLGLLDQRMGLEWVADNIGAFGGDSDAVTIWGQSAGSISVFDQLALYDGNNTYKGRSLFRAAIMDSGSIVPTEPMNGTKAQGIFDTVVEAAGCTSPPNSTSLECLRTIDYDTFQNASNSIPTDTSYYSLASGYLPRPDGRILTASMDELALTGKYAAVPMIVGHQENEGTLFSLFQSNISTEAALVSYLNDIFFRNATRDEVAGLVTSYSGYVDSPAGIGPSNDTYPEFQRLAAILGDWAFIFMARLLLETLPANISAWSYEATYESGTPVLGTFHSSDLPHLYYETDDVSTSIQNLYISFVHSLDPNNYTASNASGYLTFWPTWEEKQQLLEFGANSTQLIDSNARNASFEYVLAHLEVLRI